MLRTDRNLGQCGGEVRFEEPLHQRQDFLLDMPQLVAHLRGVPDGGDERIGRLVYSRESVWSLVPVREKAFEVFCGEVPPQCSIDLVAG